VGRLRISLSAAPGHRLVLAGQGGIGKTTLSRHFANTHAADYDGVLSTIAASRQQVIDGLCAACAALDLPAPAQPREHDATAATAAIAKHIAETGRPWLILYDNLESRADLDGLVPPGAHVLVTTRQGLGWAGWEVVQTDVLGFATPDAPAVRLLMDHAGRDDDPQAARALAAALGGLPLALIVMGAYLRDQDLGFAEGRDRLAEVLDRASPNAGYPDSLMGALRLSYEKLGADARTIARLCACWAPEGLGPWLLIDAPGGAVLGRRPRPDLRARPAPGAG